MNQMTNHSFPYHNNICYSHVYVTTSLKCYLNNSGKYTGKRCFTEAVSYCSLALSGSLLLFLVTSQVNKVTLSCTIYKSSLAVKANLLLHRGLRSQMEIQSWDPFVNWTRLHLYRKNLDHCSTKELFINNFGTLVFLFPQKTTATGD